MPAYDNNYSRFVAWLKILLPLVALGILSTLFLVSQSVDPSRAVKLSDVDIDDLVREQRIGKPSYSGVTDNGDAFTVTADSANPNFGEDKGVSAQNIHAFIETKKGTTIEIVAEAGVFDRKSKHAAMTDGVMIYVSTGYRIVTDALFSTLGFSEIETKSPIALDGPFGKLTGGKMVLTQQSPKGSESNYLLVFTNGVNLIYNPQK